MDFFKIYEKKTDKLIAVINLNYMFPVPKSEINELEYDKIDTYREFCDIKDMSQYIYFLKKEIKLINKMNVEISAKRLYDLKKQHPENKIAKRCIDFNQLEDKARSYTIR